MQISGETIIFRNEHEGRTGKWYSYAIGVSKKRDDGSYAREYLDVMFRKGVVVENKARINIKDSFLTVREYTNKDGETKSRLMLMVLDFENATGAEQHNTTGFSALDYSDVPF